MYHTWSRQYATIWHHPAPTLRPRGAFKFVLQSYIFKPSFNFLSAFVSVYSECRVRLAVGAYLEPLLARLWSAVEENKTHKGACITIVSVENAGVSCKSGIDMFWAFLIIWKICILVALGFEWICSKCYGALWASWIRGNCTIHQTDRPVLWLLEWHYFAG